jgi:hypothetical protein
VKSWFANWKTTTAGLGMIMSGISGVLHWVNPEIPGPDPSTAFASFMAGIGLLFAKDGNVTGGTTRQAS